VVVAMGVLTAGIIKILDPVAQFQKSQDTKRRSDLSQIQKAVERYYQDVGSYPANYAKSDYRIKGLNGDLINWGSPWLPYMEILPADPNASRRYVYVSTGQAYYIYASLEREVNVLSHLPSDASCGSKSVAVECDYGISSPNVNP
jgi:hypothetical protein